jgi:hypothetical protein
MKETSRTLARDLGNQLFPDSILNENIKERQVMATEASVIWALNNPEEASERGTKGGDACMAKGVGIHALTFEQMSEQGKKNYEAGLGIASLTPEQRSEIGKEFGKPNLVGEIICGVCGRTTNIGNYTQSHGDNCRELHKVRLIDALPNIFTSAIIDIIAEKIGILNVEQLNIKHNTCEYTKVDVMVENPNNFKPQWYKKNIEKIKTFKQNYEIIVGKKYEESVDVISYEDLFSINEIELQKNIIKDNKKALSKARKQYSNTQSGKEHLTKISRENALKRINKKIQKFKSILELISSDTFTLKDVQTACKEYGIEKWYDAEGKKIIKEKTLVEQIYKGKGLQYKDPSIYKQII